MFEDVCEDRAQKELQNNVIESWNRNLAQFHGSGKVVAKGTDTSLCALLNPVACSDDVNPSRELIIRSVFRIFGALPRFEIVTINILL